MTDDDDDFSDLDRRPRPFVRVVAAILVVGLFVLFTNYFVIWLINR